MIRLHRVAGPPRLKADFMLGIKRTLAFETDGTVASCHNTMVPFVEGMAKAFEEYLPKN